MVWVSVSFRVRSGLRQDWIRVAIRVMVRVRICVRVG